MTDSSLLQIFGLVYLTIGLGMFFSPSFYRTMISRMIENEAVLFLAGLTALIIGFFLVGYHNVWWGGRAVVVTVIGYLALIKGLLLLIAPAFAVRLYRSFRFSEKTLGLYSFFVLVLGLTLFYLGCSIL